MHMLVILRLIAAPSERMDANDAFTCLKHLHPPNHFGVKNKFHNLFDATAAEKQVCKLGRCNSYLRNDFGKI